MEIHQESIDTFKAGVSRLPVNVRKKWVRTLTKSKQYFGWYRGGHNCYCAMGALKACTKKSRKDGASFSELLTDCKLDNWNLDGWFHTTVNMNDNNRVPFSLFRKWINETLPSNS